MPLPQRCNVWIPKDQGRVAFPSLTPCETERHFSQAPFAQWQRRMKAIMLSLQGVWEVQRESMSR